MKEINEDTKLEPWNADISFVQKNPQGGTITIAASSEEEARAVITEMFPADSELKIIQVYPESQCPSIREILAKRAFSPMDKKEIN